MSLVRVPCDIITTDDSKVILKPQKPLVGDADHFITVTTAVKSQKGQALEKKFDSKFRTAEEDPAKDWILWWGCDNDGEKPIIIKNKKPSFG